MTNVSALVQEGIAAAKSGRRADARRALMRAVELDDHHEQAWLWLSGVAEGIEDQIICLENVLTINPGNAAAERGLQHLRAQRPPAPEPAAAEAEAAAEPALETPDGGPAADGINLEPSVEPAEVQFVRDYETRPQGLMSLIASWIAALAFNRRGAYEYEIFSASAGRTVGGIVLGGVIIPLLIGLVPAILLISSLSPNWLAVLPTLAAAPLVIIPSAIALIIQFYLWAGGLYLVSWVVGGKASFAVHTHLLSIAYAAASLLTSLAALVGGALVAALVELPATGDLSAMGMATLVGPAVVGLVIALYILAMQGQALSTAHRFSWPGGIGVLILSSLLFGLLVILAVMLLVLFTNVNLGDLPLPASW
jgi:hypothetical protein